MEGKQAVGREDMVAKTKAALDAIILAGCSNLSDPPGLGHKDIHLALGWT